MTHETTAPVQSLHDQIMRLPCTPPKDANVNQSISYKSGHRDARHAAAELAAAYEADAQQAAPVSVPDGWKMVPVDATGEMVGALKTRIGVTSRGGILNAGHALNAAIDAAPTPPAGQGESPCTTPEQQPVAWITIEEPFHGTAGIEAGEWDIQCDGKAIDKLASANSPGRIPLYAAPPAQQSQWVPSSKQLPPLDIPVWLSDEGRGVFIGMRSSSTDGWLWAECDAYRFFGGQWESIDAHFDDFKPTHWMPLPTAPGDIAAPEQAEHPHQVNRSVIRDVFLRNGFTIKEGHDDLKPYVYAAAEELLALDGKEVVTEQDAVKVPIHERWAEVESICWRIFEDGKKEFRGCTKERLEELRDLLGGGA